MPRTTSEGNRERRNSLSVPKENTKKGFFKFTSYQVPEVDYNFSIYLILAKRSRKRMWMKVSKMKETT